MRAPRISGGSARGLVFAVVCALVIPGGGAVGFHSSGGGRFVKRLHAPYAEDTSGGFGGCNITTICTFDASADKTSGEMSVTGTVRATLPVSLGGSGESIAIISAEDVLNRAAHRRGYTVTLHVDRADFHSNGGQAFALLGVRVVQPDCGCGPSSGVQIHPGHEGEDIVRYLDIGEVEAGSIFIHVSLEGFAEQSDVLALGSSGESSFNVELSLTEIDVFR